MGDLGDILCHLGPSWGDRGAVLVHLGPSWGHLGAILKPSWGILGHLVAILGHLEDSQGHLGAILGPSHSKKAAGANVRQAVGPQKDPQNGPKTAPKRSQKPVKKWMHFRRLLKCILERFLALWGLTWTALDPKNLQKNMFFKILGNASFRARNRIEAVCCAIFWTRFWRFGTDRREVGRSSVQVLSLRRSLGAASRARSSKIK